MAGTMRQRPFILTSRTVSAMVPPGARGNVAWNEDGQCLFLTKRAVVILTPYLTTTLPPPLSLVDPNLNFEYPISVVLRERKARAEKLREESMDPEADTPGGSTPQPTLNAEAGPSQPRRIAKPKGGEVKWWNTSVEVDKDGNRDKYYGWTDSGDEFGGTLGGKEVFVKSATWSPSGLSELGGCLLAVMTTSGQVSIYTPRTNATTKQWDEIADMTIQTQDMLGSDDSPVPIVLQMRMISMAWSTTPPAVEMIGMDGSLLALASRAGMVALWTYGRERQFTCDAYLKVSDEGWVTQMAWSSWQQIGPARYEARLALALTECSIAFVPIQRGRNLGGGWDLTFGTMDWIDNGDRRVITALKWIDGLLVWAKSGSIHLWSSQEGTVDWKGVQEVRLDRVGNWAGANPLGSCIGIEMLDSDRLVVTLASLTQHIITSIRTAPALAPPTDSLRLSLGIRDCALAHLKEDPKPIPDERQLSVITTGLAAVGYRAGVSCWASEIMNLHNLDSANEGVRSMNFVMADLGGVSGAIDDLIEGLRQAMKTPPALLQTSPLKVLLPYMMRILTSLDPKSLVDSVLEICSSEPESSPPEETNDALTNDERLMRALWARSALDGMRLRMVLARWAMVAFPAARRRFDDVVTGLELEIQQAIVAALTGWLAAKLEALSDLKLLSPSETEFTGLIATLSADNASSSRINTIIGHPDIQQQCPICSSPVDHGLGGTTACSKGHEWARCCLSHVLITTPAHRICSVCPAVSLLPERYKTHPIPVAQDGTATDWQRFRINGDTPPRVVGAKSTADRMEGIEGADRGADEDAGAIDTRLSTTRRDLVQLALEAGVVCPQCGGRWVRVA